MSRDQGFDLILFLVKIQNQLVTLCIPQIDDVYAYFRFGFVVKIQNQFDLS